MKCLSRLRNLLKICVCAVVIGLALAPRETTAEIACPKNCHSKFIACVVQPNGEMMSVVTTQCAVCRLHLRILHGGPCTLWPHLPWDQ